MMQESDMLIYRFLDRDIDEEGIAMLAEWLAEDKANLRRYALLASEEHVLREYTRRLVAKPSAEDRAQLMRDLLLMEESAEAKIVAWTEPKIKAVPDFHHQFKDSTKVPRAEGLATSGWLIAGALAFAAIIAVILLVPPQAPQIIPPTIITEGDAIPKAQAVIQSSDGVVWGNNADSTSKPGERLPTGQIELVSGQMTIRFDGGATVVVVGPSTFSIDNEKSMQLEAGQAVVRSSEYLLDFSVAIPSARLVTANIASGSTFGICTNDLGSQVTVFHGEIGIFNHDMGGDRSAAIGRISHLESFQIDLEGQHSAIEFDQAAYQELADDGLVPLVVNRTIVLRQGYDNYRGTVDTWFSKRESINESQGFPDGTYLRIGEWETTNQQAVLRFGGLADAGLPANARILDATLVLHNPNDITDGFGVYASKGDAFSVHRLLTAWQEADAYGARPWSEGETPQVDRDGIEASVESESDSSRQLSDIDGYLIPAGSRIELDVTSSVALWASGQPNHGFLLQSLGAHQQSERGAGQEADAIFLASSEYETDSALRPALIITFLSTE